MDRARILLADDNEALLGLTAKILTPSFEVVGIANDGWEPVSKGKLTPSPSTGSWRKHRESDTLGISDFVTIPTLPTRGYRPAVKL
jgi:hypothetical protein